MTFHATPGGGDPRFAEYRELVDRHNRATVNRRCTPCTRIHDAGVPRDRAATHLWVHSLHGHADLLCESCHYWWHHNAEDDPDLRPLVCWELDPVPG